VKSGRIALIALLKNNGQKADKGSNTKGLKKTSPAA
jgi:hypothetical protein